MNINETLSETFIAMWEVDSPVRREWQAIETLYASLKDIADGLTARSYALRNIVEIEADMKARTLPMGQLVLETLSVWWNRIAIRSCLKARDAVQLMFFSCNTANAHGCALAARSIIEHVASLQYFINTVPWRDSPLVAREELTEFTKQFHNLLYGSSFAWDKFLEGGVSVRKLIATGEWKRPGKEKIPHITELVKTLDKELSRRNRNEPEGRILFVYSALCDVVHPSWGGDFIYAPRIYRDVKATQEHDEHFKRVATLFCLPIGEIIRHMSYLIRFMLDNEPKMLATMKE